MSGPVRGSHQSPGSIDHMGNVAGNIVTTIVVICLMLVMSAMCAPSIIRPRGKAKEAEVKQNLHAIQLAVERYATDHDGNYPAFLYGGDMTFNAGTVHQYNPENIYAETGYPNPLHHPFDQRNVESDSLDYADVSWKVLYEQALGLDNDEVEACYNRLLETSQIQDGESIVFGDILTAEGYLPSYPKNPFAKTQQRNKRKGLMVRRDWYVPSPDLPSVYSLYGGQDGRSMFNIGVFGEMVQLSRFDTPTTQPQSSFPGCFYYHPRFADGVSNHGHLLAAQALNPEALLPGDVFPGLKPPLDDSADVSSQLVGGYDLFATGSVRTKGQDLDNSVSLNGVNHAFRTGYATLAQERNPWVQAGDYPGQTDFDERPYSDGFPDFYIIHLGAGMDKKVGAGNIPK